MTGFQSPCAEYGEEKLSLDKKFLSNPPAMFIVRASAHAPHFEIHQGDFLIIDRSRTPKHNDLVIAVIANEFKTARYLQQGGRVSLFPYHITLGSDELSEDFIWGVVASLHRKLNL